MCITLNFFMMKRYILLISAICNIAVTAYLSIETPFGMLDQRSISDLYTTLITPAGFTFWIWSIIYASWCILWLYILRYPKRIKKKSVRLLTIAQCLSTLWLIPSQLTYIPVSLVIMLWIVSLLFTLIHKKQKDIFVSCVIQLFLWWILVATIANIHQTLVFFDIYIYPEILSIISVIIGTCINMYLILKYKYIPSLVFIWALYWIYVAQNYPAVSIMTLSSAIVLAFAMLVSLWSLKK